MPIFLLKYMAMDKRNTKGQQKKYKGIAKEIQGDDKRSTRGWQKKYKGMAKEIQGDGQKK